jgi:hypothetical protein
MDIHVYIHLCVCMFINQYMHIYIQEQSWEIWWKEENSFFKNLPISWKCLLIVQKCVLWTFIGAGLGGSRLYIYAYIYNSFHNLYM